MITSADDSEVIAAIIARQFASLNWTPSETADWAAFAADFVPGARLYPSARPLRSQTVDEFVVRMKGLARSALPTFHERLLGTKIHVFGNIAVAVAAVEITENNAHKSRSVEMLLLAKEQGTWKILNQAWDGETADRPIPTEYLGGQGGEP